MNTKETRLAIAEITILKLKPSKSDKLPEGDENTLYLDMSEVGKLTDTDGPSMYLVSPDMLRERLGELEKLDDIRNRNLKQDYMVIVIDRIHSLEVRINLKKNEMDKYIESQNQEEEQL